MALMTLRRRGYLEAFEPDLSYLLLPKGKTPHIGAEKGSSKKSGIARYDSPHGSHRYVMYENGKAVAALQVMKSGGKALAANVFVPKEYRRKGYATQLLRQARKDFGKVELSKGRSKAGAGWASVHESILDEGAVIARETAHVGRALGIGHKEAKKLVGIFLKNRKVEGFARALRKKLPSLSFDMPVPRLYQYLANVFA